MDWIKLDFLKTEGDFVTSVRVGGKKLCVVKDGGKLYALQNTCPHAGGVLSGGWCKDGNIICPIHRYEYNLETGKGLAGQSDYIEVYPLERREDGWYVGFEQRFWRRIFSK
jgi:nitrite reductase/ring-hydroxylating ferredoxin subunit